MRNRLLVLTLMTFLAVAPAPFAGASVESRSVCPMIVGLFTLLDGELWIEITKEDGKAVAKHREKIANPLDEKSHQALAQRGPVKVEVHQATSGGLFVHWGTLADDK